MKRLILLFLFYSHLILSQQVNQSTREIGVKHYKPTQTIKEKISKMTGKVIGTEKGEFNGIYDNEFYELKNGNISFGPDVEYMHIRMIFDKDENWLETQELFHSDVQKNEEYYQIEPKLMKRIKKLKKYYVLSGGNYIKVTNRNGFWYEVEASILPKKKEQVILLFDKKLKFIKERKKEII